jgi:hypothetical protein
MEANYMRSKTSRIIAAVVVIGAVAAGGAAFTASSGLPATATAGYDTSTVSGATATNLHYVLGDNGASVTSAVVTFDASQSGKTITAGFANGGTPNQGTCSLDVPTSLVATCTFTGQTTELADTFHLAVVDTP